MVNDRRRWFGSIGVACMLVMTAMTPRAHADEIWVAPTAQTDMGGLGIGSNVFWPATAAGVVRLAWAVPDDLQAFQSAKVVLIPHSPSPGGSASLNVFVCAAQNGNLVGASCAGPFTQVFSAGVNQLSEVEIGPMLASRIGVPGANYLAVLAYSTPTTSTDHIVGLRFAYDPAPPAGVATLGANTFSGTQTATAFVGNGSGLTGLPFPAGAEIVEKKGERVARWRVRGKLRVAFLTKGSDGATNFRFTSLYGQTTPLALVNGVDARLVEAEARLAANDIAGMVTILNALRATTLTIGTVTVTSAQLPPLATPATRDGKRKSLAAVLAPLKTASLECRVLEPAR